MESVESFVHNVVYTGHQIDSRYGKCFEVLGGRFEIKSGSLVTRFGINYSLGWMELLQLVAGVYDPEGLKRVAPNADHSLFTYSMAYGPRISYAAPMIINALKTDPNTRQAVLFIGKPEDGPTKDLPCTTAIQFLVRNHMLHAVVSMRSWDLCRGLPYDLMMFSGLLEVFARCLDIPTGNVVVQAGSAHVYMDQMDKTPETSSKKWRFVGDAPTYWPTFVEWAKFQLAHLPRGGTPGHIEVF